jgi:hypothetical protein
MLRKFAGILLATALVAGPAFAATDNAGSAAVTTPSRHHVLSKRSKVTKHTKIVTHARKHAHKHLVHGKLHKTKQAQHLKPAPKHKAHLGKTAKVAKS